MNDDFLSKFTRAPRREFAASLYQRISKPMKTPSRIQSFRPVTLALSLVVMIAAVLIFSPATRALADDIIHQFGTFIFVQAAPEPKPIGNDAAGQQAVEEPKKPDQPQQPKAQQPSDGASAAFAEDVATASQLSGFTVLAPAYLPDGYVSTRDSASGEWTILHGNGEIGNGEVRVSISYQDPTGENFITIEQLSNQTNQSKTVESQEIVDVTVHGQAGIWLPDGPRKNMLVWEENGITYLVISDDLSLDDVLKIAESLGR